MAPTVTDYLLQEKEKGRTHFRIDNEARVILRRLYQESRGKKNTPVASSPPRSPQTPAAETQAIPEVSDLKVTGLTPAAQIDSLRRQAENWAPAMALGTLREKMVFSTGDPRARVMLVGEGPGYHEEKAGEPFVGPAGKKLDQILKAMGLSREEVYLGNLCKFRPAMPNQTTNNRPPSPEEIEACLPFILAEIDIVQPEILIALGATAAQGLLATSRKIGELRGEWHEVKKIPLRATYHPSYLLHSNEGLGEKRKLWEDMLAVMERLEMPVSEKQRSFFLPK